MAAGANRYEPLREAARQAQTQAQESKPSQEDIRSDFKQEHVAAEHAARQNQPEITEEAPTRPTSLPQQSPGWTGLGPMEHHFASAIKYNDWVNSHHQQRPDVPPRGGQEPPAPEPDAPLPPTSSIEDKAQAHYYNDLKVEQAEATNPALENREDKLIFYEDVHLPKESQVKPESEKSKDTKEDKLIFYEDINPPDLEQDHER